ESQDRRLTPAQREAKALLEQLYRIKQEATVGLSFLASTSGIYGGFFPITGLWREEERRHLDRIDRIGISVALHKEGDPPVPVTVMDISKSGLRVQSHEEFSQGATVTVSLDSSGVTQQAIYFKAEVRWCEEEPDEPGRFGLGLRVVEATQEPWLELLPKLIENLDEFKRLFSSLNE
ncbi:MAG: PilZ domain-containing protein, partial [Candidatus Methylomirabilales bacterium]